MKLGLRSGSLSLALLLGIAGMGCGDDDGMTVDSGMDAGRDSAVPDTGTPDEDTGPPPPDTGVDAGPPPPEAFVRVAHLSPNTGGVRVCVELQVEGTRIGGIGPLPTDQTIPFRGITPYIPLEIAEGVTYVVKAFVVANVAEAIDCTTDGDLNLEVEAADLEDGAHYTGAAIGFSPEAGGALPSRCPDGSTPPEFDGPCPAALAVRLALFEDDSTLDAAASKIRILHAIPNAPAVDVCYDDDPEDETAPAAIASNVSFGSASDYFESPAAITSGVLTVHAHVEGASCVAAAALAPPLPIPGAFAAVRMNPAFAGVRDNIPETFVLNRIYTVFAQGIAPNLIAADNPTGVLILPWQDQPAVAAAE